MNSAKKPSGCHKTLKIVHGLFYGGLALVLLAWVVLYLSQKETSAPVVVLCVLGIVGIVSGIVLGGARLRCPCCGASLMLGGRIPTRLPKFCPECGKPLE